jgi:hypothetical protein
MQCLKHIEALEATKQLFGIRQSNNMYISLTESDIQQLMSDLNTSGNISINALIQNCNGVICPSLAEVGNIRI